jgi:hypothetical protein
MIFLLLHRLKSKVAILDSPGPSQYGPRGLEGGGTFEFEFLTAGVGT